MATSLLGNLFFSFWESFISLRILLTSLDCSPCQKQWKKGEACSLYRSAYINNNFILDQSAKPAWVKQACLGEPAIIIYFYCFSVNKLLWESTSMYTQAFRTLKKQAVDSNAGLGKVAIGWTSQQYMQWIRALEWPPIYQGNYLLRQIYELVQTLEQSPKSLWNDSTAQRRGWINPSKDTSFWPFYKAADL